MCAKMTIRTKAGDTAETGAATPKPKAASKKASTGALPAVDQENAKKAGTGDPSTGDPSASPAPNATASSPEPAAAPSGIALPGVAGISALRKPTPSRSPGTKEVIPFEWKVVGRSAHTTLVLFKSIERKDAEAHFERLRSDGYYKDLAILANNAKIVQPKGHPKPSTKSEKTTKSGKATKSVKPAKAAPSITLIKIKAVVATTTKAAAPKAKASIRGGASVKAKTTAKTTGKAKAKTKAKTKVKTKAAPKKRAAKATASSKSTKKTAAKKR